MLVIAFVSAACVVFLIDARRKPGLAIHGLGRDGMAEGKRVPPPPPRPAPRTGDKPGKRQRPCRADFGSTTPNTTQFALRQQRWAVRGSVIFHDWGVHSCRELNDGIGADFNHIKIALLYALHTGLQVVWNPDHFNSAHVRQSDRYSDLYTPFSFQHAGDGETLCAPYAS